MPRGVLKAGEFKMTKKECIRYLDGVKDHRICLACWALELRKFLTVNPSWIICFLLIIHNPASSKWPHFQSESFWYMGWLSGLIKTLEYQTTGHFEDAGPVSNSLGSTRSQYHSLLWWGAPFHQDRAELPSADQPRLPMRGEWDRRGLNGW